MDNKKQDTNEILELFGKLFGPLVQEEISKHIPVQKAPEPKTVKKRQDTSDKMKKAVEESTRVLENKVYDWIMSAKAEIIEKLNEISEKLDKAPESPLQPWTTNPFRTSPYYPYTPDPLSPLGPVITYTGDAPEMLQSHTYSVGGTSDSVSFTIPDWLESLAKFDQ